MCEVRSRDLGKTQRIPGTNWLNALSFLYSYYWPAWSPFHCARLPLIVSAPSLRGVLFPAPSAGGVAMGD